MSSHNLLRSEIQELIAQATDGLLAGMSDFGDYRQQAGYVQGLRRALVAVEDAQRRAAAAEDND